MVVLASVMKSPYGLYVLLCGMFCDYFFYVGDFVVFVEEVYYVFCAGAFSIVNC